MEPQISAIGFTPASEFLGWLQDQLLGLSEILPYDSSLSVRMVNRLGAYEFAVSAHFVGGEMRSQSQSFDLEMAMEQALSGIRKQIRQWHNDRFRTLLVLIVDDDPASAQFLDFCLKRSGCDTKSVSNGRLAIDEIASRDYDLIFLDWNMPEMDGGETLVKAQNAIGLMGRQGRSTIPVITYSGRALADIDLPKCDRFRFIDHWDKSTPFHHLLTRASEVLNRFKEW
jgi:CheY-like chemotaxis protein